MTDPVAAGDKDGQPRRIPAPQLRETADIWWDSGTDPVIVWDASGARFWLVDGIDDRCRLRLLVRSTADTVDALVIARTLAEGLAACDFPPTQDGVAHERAMATLRVAGLTI